MPAPPTASSAKLLGSGAWLTVKLQLSMPASVDDSSGDVLGANRMKPNVISPPVSEKSGWASGFKEMKSLADRPKNC